MIKLATTSMHCVYDKEKNLKKFFEYIDEASEKGANLIVFPEASLQGYLKSLTAMHIAAADYEYDYQYENAEVIPEGPSIQKIMKKAKENNIYVIFGFTEKDPDFDYKLYNTMVLVGPEGFIGSYRKVHLPYDELHIYHSGNEFKVFDTAIGKIGMLICYDKSFPESTRSLAVSGADILVMSTAWAYESKDVTDEDIDKDYMFYIYDIFDKVRALENQCFFISSNQYGLTGDIRYFGHSNIINPCGRVVASTGTAEGIVYYETESIKKDIYYGKTHGFMGLNIMKDRQPAVYNNLGEVKSFE